MQDYLLNLWNTHYEMVLSIAYKGILTLAVLAASHFVARAFRRSINHANDRIDRLDSTLVPVLSTVVTYTVYAIGAVVVLDMFGVNTTSIIAVLGAAALAIALALKDTIGNVAAGIMLLILRPFRIGDLIECSSIYGTVRETRLFTTTLETLDGLYICAPNATLWNAPITNFTRNGKRRLDIIIGISYSDSIEDGFEVLNAIIREESRLLDEPAPQVMVESMADSSVNLQLRGWTSVDDYWTTRWDLNKRVKERIEAAGLTIPFPQRDIHVIAGTPTA